MSLESLDGAIRKIFGSKHPFGAPNVGVGRARDQNPGAVMLQISNFFIHGGKPGKILSSRFEALKLSSGKKCRKKASGAEDTEICGVATLKNTSLSTCEHGMRTDPIGGDRNRRDRVPRQDPTVPREKVDQRPNWAKRDLEQNQNQI